MWTLIQSVVAGLGVVAVVVLLSFAWGALTRGTHNWVDRHSRIMR